MLKNEKPKAKSLLEMKRRLDQDRCPHCHVPFKPITIHTDFEGCTLIMGAPYKKGVAFTLIFVKFNKDINANQLFTIVSASPIKKLKQCPVCWRKISK